MTTSTASPAFTGPARDVNPTSPVHIGGSKPSIRPSPYIRCLKPSLVEESLKLEWAFGLHKDFKSVIHNLSSVPNLSNSRSSSHTSRRIDTITTTTPFHEQRRVFYPLAHVGIIYSVFNNSQQHLLGHEFTIVATCCSHNRRFVVTADEGDRSAWGLRNTVRQAQREAAMLTQEQDYLASAEEEERMIVSPGDARIDGEDDGSVMVVWDMHTGLPVKTIPVGKYGGVVSCSMSMDGLYIATLNRRMPQEVMVWGWTAESDTGETNEGYDTGADLAPEFVRRIPAKDEQTSVRFSSDNPHLLTTNGLRRVLFWSWSEKRLKYYSPPIIQSDWKVPIGNFTQTILVPGTTMACSGTVDGDIVLWQLQPKDRVTKEQDKTLLKMVRVHSGGVTFITTAGGYIVTGGMDGQVKFLDSKLRLVAWFDELNGGPIISISFDKPSTTVNENTVENAIRTSQHVMASGTTAAAEFLSPDFMVSTASAMLIDVPAKAFHTGNRNLLRGKLVVQGQDQAILSVAAHPSLPRLAVAGLSGNLHLWEYQQKRVLILSLFRNLQIRCMAFDPTGGFLMVGFTNGVVKVLEAESLEEKQTFKPKQPDSVLRLVFSPDGNMMASGTAGGSIGLYELKHSRNDRSRPLAWEFIGHHQTHKAPICGLHFNMNTHGEMIRLISVGEDKRLIEYNLVESDAEAGLLLRAAHKITQGAVPTGFLWAKELQLLDDCSRPRGAFENANADSTKSNLHEENYLILATNEYKLGVYLSDWSRQCVKTVLSPTFGGPMREMAIVPSKFDTANDLEKRNKCLVYSTQERVVGLAQLPLRGDPCDSMGLLAHPGQITSIAVSYDGKYLFTAGGEDQAVLQWRIDGDKIMPPSDVAAARATPSGVPLDHLIAAIEGGADGELMTEIVDYYYYAQIRSQGEETTAKRELLGAIHFSQMPNLLRALGYYPSELDIGHLTYEVANMYGPKGQPLEEVDVDSILLDFAQFLRLYVNYRPVFGITRQDVECAFRTLGADAITYRMSRDEFFKLLSTMGESLHASEITAALTSLLGEGVRVEMLEEYITARAFAENLLGFEDYNADGAADVDDVEENDDSETYDDDELGRW